MAHKNLGKTHQKVFFKFAITQSNKKIFSTFLICRELRALQNAGRNFKNFVWFFQNMQKTRRVPKNVNF